MVSQLFNDIYLQSLSTTKLLGYLQIYAASSNRRRRSDGERTERPPSLRHTVTSHPPVRPCSLTIPSLSLRLLFWPPSRGWLDARWGLGVTTYTQGIQFTETGILRDMHTVAGNGYRLRKYGEPEGVLREGCTTRLNDTAKRTYT